MNTTRHGKIARLPKALREELNRRLENGEPGKRLVAWLNTRPEVQALVATEFGGKPVREQNLSEWKTGGYRDWLVQQEALELATRLAEDAGELQVAGRPPLTDTLALWLTARYAVATRQVNAADGVAGWRQLRELCADVVELRRGDHSAERLRLEREALEQQRQHSEEKMKERFLVWVKQPENHETIYGRKLTDAEKARRIREIYGLAPLEPVAEDENVCAVETPPVDPVEFSCVEPDAAPGAGASDLKPDGKTGKA